MVSEWTTQKVDNGNLKDAQEFSRWKGGEGNIEKEKGQVGFMRHEAMVEKLQVV